ncbi:MAG: PspC domain-containing protein [bacterium]|nr:PspC domain-containing protein [bacterium]
MANEQTSGSRPYKRLVRIHRGRMIAGVRSGFGHYFNVDPVLIRLLWIAFVLLAGTGILVYLIAWIVMPLEDPS